jgi:ABC-type transporter Mla MlaB component
VFGKIFGKKEEVKKPVLVKPKPPGSSDSSGKVKSSTATPAGLGDKIDELEADIAAESLDFTAATPRAAPKAEAAASNNDPLDFTSSKSAAPAAAPAAPARPGGAPDAKGPVSTLNLEITSSPFEKAPVIEEAAILYANEQDDAAIAALMHSIEHDDLPKGIAPQVWLMLFDLYQNTNKRKEFDDLSIEYSVRFELSPPGWNAATPQKVNPQLATGGGSYFSLTGNLDNDSTKQFEQLKRMAEKSRILRIEYGKIDTIAPEGCELLWKSLVAFKQSGHDLVFSNPQHLMKLLTNATQTGRNSDPQVYWLLLLELMQFQQLQNEFEETALNYCITYEVSPPSWEEPKKAAKVSETAKLGNTQSTETITQDAMVLSGAIDAASVDAIVANMNDFASTRAYPVFDVGLVKRIDFVAGGALLNAVTGMHKGESYAELKNCGPLVGALLLVMGLQNHCKITRRK